MVKREDIFAKAFENQKKKLAKKQAEYDIKYAAFVSVEPRLAELDRRLASLGAQTAITALSGDSSALEALQKEIAEVNAERKALLSKMELKAVEYDCLVCRDTGYVGGKICECIRSEVKRLTIKALCEELSIDDCRFDNFDLSYYPSDTADGANPHDRMEQILAFCHKYTASFNPESSESLIFMGDTGIGKTHLSFAIVCELLQKGFDVVYGSAYNFISKIEAENFRERSNENYNAVISCDLLVIDDLGSEYTTPYFQSMLFNIINTRLLAKRPVLINTNLSVQELENRYTPRVSSRIFGNYKIQKFLGSDIRLKKMIARHNEGAKNV